MYLCFFPLRQPNLSFRHSDGCYVTSRAVTLGEELFISYDRDYFPGYTDAFRARELRGEDPPTQEPSSAQDINSS